MTKAKAQPLGSIFGPDARRGQPARPPAAPPLPAQVAALIAVVDRVEAVLDAEIDVLARGIPADMTEFGNRKRQGLLEMGRALRAAAAAGPRAEIRDRLSRFAAKLDRNRAALDTQLRAVREVADIVARTLQEAESDGTYSLVTMRS